MEERKLTREEIAIQAIYQTLVSGMKPIPGTQEGSLDLVQDAFLLADNFIKERDKA